jgi:RecA-family ATPase
MARAATSDSSPVARRDRWSARDLLETEFPEPRWAVPGIIAEGLNLLAGAPKAGKSWAALGLGLAVASGGRAFGRIEVEQGDALYLSLEDPPRRLQRRLRQILGTEAAPARLDIWTASERFPEGVDPIEAWCDDHPNARLVMVDVLAKVRPLADPKQSSYDGDYRALHDLKRLVDERGLAAVVLHHTRKANADDWLDTVSGTQGLAGASDAVIVLRHQHRGSATAELLVTGRDVEDAKHALEFRADIGSWCLLDGPAEDYELGDTRRDIVRLLRDNEALTPKQVAERLGVDDKGYERVKKTMRRMADDDQIDTDGAGHYFPLSLVPHVPVVPLFSVPGDTRDTGDTLDGGTDA